MLYICRLSREGVVMPHNPSDVSPHLKPERRYPPATGLQLGVWTRILGVTGAIYVTK